MRFAPFLQSGFLPIPARGCGQKRRLPHRREALRRRHHCRSNSGSSEEQRLQQERQLQEVVSSRVEQAAKLLDDIIDDVVCDLSAVQSIGYIYEEAPEETEAQIVQKVVKRFLDQLDQNFLASLESFQQKSKNIGHPDVARLIGKIRSEVFAQINDEFPPEVLLLEDLMKMPDKKDRIAKIREVSEAPESPKEDSPTETPPTLTDEADFYMDISEDTPVEEMDLERELKRLKILKTESGLKSLKEELEKEPEGPVEVEVISEFDQVMDSVDNPLDGFEPDESVPMKHEYGKSISPLQLGLAANQFITDIEEKEEIANRQLLAKLCVIREEARLVETEMRFSGKEMEENPVKHRQNVPAQVMGVIQMLIKTRDPIKRVGLIRKAFEKDEYGPASKDLNRAPGYVRPGIFMTALTMTQLEADTRSKQKATASEIPSLMLQRIDDVRLEAMLVLRELGWGEFSSDELSQRLKERQERREEIKESLTPQK